MKARRNLLAAPFIAILALLAMALPAGAAGPTTPSTGIVRVQNQVHVVNADLANQINSGDWSGLTTAQLASAGIHPGMAFPDGTHPKAAASGGMTPDSASGCNQRVCIYVWGTGLWVDEWDTSATNSSYLCTYAGYWVAGVVMATSNTVCAGSGDFWAYSYPQHYYINGTKLCNTWLNLAGKPCETVLA